MIFVKYHMDAMMRSVGLILLFYLTGFVCSEQPPSLNVSCLVVNLEYVHCTWNGQESPKVNYTFHSRFLYDKPPEFHECDAYILDNRTIIGCNQTYIKLLRRRLDPFIIKLMPLSDGVTQEQKHMLKSKVKLNPPTNLTVTNDSDSNLWFFWNHSAGVSTCVESQVRHRINFNKWEITNVRGRSHTINLPSSSCRYELQARSTIQENCGASNLWSDWSESAFWGSMKESNSTDTSRLSGAMSVWTPVLYAVGLLILIILVTALVHHERLRIIFIPIVPGKNLNRIMIEGSVEEWLHISKGVKEGFKAHFNERACSVREYRQVLQSASDSSGGSAASLGSDQTDGSVSENDSTFDSCSSAALTSPGSSEERQDGE